MELLNFGLLAKYNKKTNELMNNIIMELTEDEWNKEFTGFFKSIHELNSHIYICDFNWLKRFKKLREFTVLKNNIFEKDLLFTETIFKNINEYVLLRSELDKIFIEFINELKNEDLKNLLKFVNSKGVKMERKMESLVMHVFNHQAHHRGMVSLYLEMLGKENSFSDSMYNMELN